jgi:O-Antigen ligase
MTIEAANAPPQRAAHGITVLGARAYPALVGALPVAGLAAAQGGYFPTSWGWATLPFLWITCVALVVRPVVGLSGAEWIFLGGLTGLTAWLAASSAWSVAPAETVLEVERQLLYLAGAAAVLLAVSSRRVEWLVGGLLVAIVGISAFSLGTRLFPDRIGVFDRASVYRLSEPIGYWNGLALFTAMGALLAIGFAARGRTIAARAASAAALVVLLPTFYFTFGRAGWIALGVGLVAALALDPRRVQLLVTLLVVAPAPAIGVWLCSREPSLTRSGSGLTPAAHEGHRIALALLVLAAASACAASLYAALERRMEVPRLASQALIAAVVLALVLGGAAIFSRYGGPVHIVTRGYDAFTGPPPHVTNLNRRLLSFSGNGRADLWQLAWDDARSHPLLGSGGGTYERYFLAHMPRDIGRVRDAHGLYIETLAELGPVGLALMLSFLLVPIVFAKTVRRHPLVPALAGAYAAYLVHAGVDWDWELPTVTLAALFCGAGILAAGHSNGRSEAASAPSLRWGGMAVAIVISGFVAVGLVGNTALASSHSARTSRNFVRAAADANKARQWMPWSPAPLAALGLAQLEAGLDRQARVNFKRALAKDSGDWLLWYDLSRASSGRARERALEHALALFPQSGLKPQAATP